MFTVSPSKQSPISRHLAHTNRLIIGHTKGNTFFMGEKVLEGGPFIKYFTNMRLIDIRKLIQ